MKYSFNNLQAIVYKNLHNGLWSVKAKNGSNKGRVVFHTDDILIINASFYVNENGRQRVIYEQKKNVHAGIVGQIVYANIEQFRYNIDEYGYQEHDVTWIPFHTKHTIKISYNPYRGGSFYRWNDEIDLKNDRVRTVWLNSKGAFVAIDPVVYYPNQVA